MDVEAHMCRSRGAHVACTRAYNGQGARKKIRPHMCTYGRGLECLLAHTYMGGLEHRNSVVVVFMGSQPAGSERNAWSCSSGGLGRNRRWKRGLNGVLLIGRGLAYRKMEETALCSTSHVRNGILFIGRGLPYRKMEETDLLRSKRGSC